MPKLGNARQLRRLARVSRRIRDVIGSGLLSVAPDELAAPVLDAAVTLARTAEPTGAQLDRAELAVAELERWGDDTVVPAYKHNAYARSWMRLRSGLSGERRLEK
jgi:hypothetical protein